MSDTVQEKHCLERVDPRVDRHEVEVGRVVDHFQEAVGDPENFVHSGTCSEIQSPGSGFI